MRKLSQIIAVLLLIAAASVLSYRSGIRHALECSEMWIMSYDQFDPFDLEIMIDLDGNTYSHGCYIG